MLERKTCTCLFSTSNKNIITFSFAHSCTETVEQVLDWVPINEDCLNDEDFMSTLKYSSLPMNLRRTSRVKGGEQRSNRRDSDNYDQDRQKQRRNGVYQFSLAPDRVSSPRNRARAGSRKLTTVRC